MQGLLVASAAAVVKSNIALILTLALTLALTRYAALDAYAGVWIAHCLHALHAAQGGRGALTSWLSEQAACLPARKRKAD